MRAEALRGHLDGLLLAALEAGPSHGFAIMAQLRVRTGGSVDLEGGTLYPALRRLEAGGLVTSAWTVVNSRRRREYHLTDKGRTRLSTERRSWQEFATAVTRGLQPSNPATTPGH